MELLLAVAIAAIALAIVNMTFFQSHAAMESVRIQGEVYQMVRLALDRMNRDLTCAYVPSGNRQLDADELAMYRFVGRNESRDETDMDSLFFTTTCDIGFQNLSGGVCEVDYYLKEMEDQEELFTLMRREDCRPHAGLTEGGMVMEIAEDVVGMQITYLDANDKEVEVWDLEQSLQLPAQIRITLTFRKGSEDLTFTTVSSPPLAHIKLALKSTEE